jgi:serine/threonine-protein kinase SRPK3
MPVQLAATLGEIEEAYAHEGGIQCQETGLIGEETLTRFNSRFWFAVRVGDTLCDRYKVLGKVANGGSSTIWFVQDTEWVTSDPYSATRSCGKPITDLLITSRTEDYAILKISIKSSTEDAREQRAFDLINKRVEANSTHPGLLCLQRPIRDFVVESPRTGRHHCFLLVPSAGHVEDAWRVLRDLPLTLTQEILLNTLQALDFLHTECLLIHTDLKLDNILFGFAGDDIVAEYVSQLANNPERSKIHRGKDGDDEYPVTKAKPFVLTRNSFAFPQLNDLGESVRIPIHNMGYAPARRCSPKAFRAPEILLKRPISAAIDVWMVGCMTLQMLTGKVPILPRGVNQPWKKAYTLAQHHALLGPPPKAFLAQCGNARNYWNESGDWAHPLYDIPDVSFESLLASVEDETVRKDAIDFVRCCMQWLPGDRSSARELAKHRFLVAQKARLWRTRGDWEK